MKKILFFLVCFLTITSMVNAGDLHTRATGAAAIATTVAPSATKPWQLHQFTIKLSAVGGAGNLTVTTDANAGAAYDVLHLTQDMTAVTHLVVTYDPPVKFNPGDELDFAWANGSTRTYGLDVVFTTQ